jgi:uncharacterized protein (DUF2267 family)
VQDYSGIYDREAQDALELTVESLAVYLAEGGRKDFASQLPQELQDLALSVEPTNGTADEDILQQFKRIEQIDEPRAKKQLLAAWQALKDASSEGQIQHIKSQMPNPTVALLH